MTVLRVSGFGGIIPRLGKRLLPNNNAQYALNSQLFSGELRSWQRPKLLQTFAMPSVQDVYHYRRDEVDHYIPFAVRTDVVKAPIINDAYDRLYWTNGTAMYTTTQEDVEANIAPVITGVPLPVFGTKPVVDAPQIGSIAQPTFGTAPTVTPSGGTASLSETRVYSFVLVATDGEEGKPKPGGNVTATGNADGNWNIANLNTVVNPGSPIDKLRVYRSAVVATRDPIWQRVIDWPIAAVPAGAFNDTLTPYIQQDDGNQDIVETRVYVFILVTKYGEEGPPNEDSTITLEGKSDGTWVIHNLNTLVPPGGNVTKLRIYRTITSSGTGVAYRQVAEFDVGAVPATYNDNVTNEVLATNPVLQSLSWDAPPLGLSGLCAGPNGMLSAFKGKTVYFSVPYFPHAWPDSQQLAIEDTIVAMAWVGTMLVIGTTGRPAVVQGSTPTSLTLQKFGEVIPCLSRDGLVGTSVTVFMPSLDGLMSIGPDGVQNVTQAFCARKDWLDRFSPASISGAIYQNRYFGFYSSQLGFSLGFDDATTGLTDLQYDGITRMKNSAVDNSAHLIVGNKLYQWDADPEGPLLYVWRTKPFMVPKPCNFGALQLRGDFLATGMSTVDAPVTIDPSGHAIDDQMINADPINGVGNQPSSMASDTIAVKIYGDDKLRYAGAIRTEEPVRLPSGYKATKWEVEVAGNLSVFSVVLAGTFKELEQTP